MSSAKFFTGHAQENSKENIQNSKATLPEKYKVIFPQSINITKYKALPVKDKSIEAYNESIPEFRVKRSFLQSFIQQLNELGTNGYKLIALGNQFIGIVEYTGENYEYEFTSGSPLSFQSNEEFTEDCKLKFEKGFVLFDSIGSYTRCEYDNPYSVGEWNSTSQTCVYRGTYLYERKLGESKSTNYKIIKHKREILKGYIKMSGMITDSIKQGFYPYRIVSEYDVMLRESDKNNHPEYSDVIVFDSHNSKDLLKNINKHAKDGYRLGLIRLIPDVKYFPNTLALMYKSVELPNQKFTYNWLDVSLLRITSRGDDWNNEDENVEKKLLDYSSQGYRVHLIGRDFLRKDRFIVLEKSETGSQPASEYKLLTFELESKKDNKNNTIEVSLTPESIADLEMMNKLAESGYKIRGMLDLDQGRIPIDLNTYDVTARIKILMERDK